MVQQLQAHLRERHGHYGDGFALRGVGPVSGRRQYADFGSEVAKLRDKFRSDQTVTRLLSRLERTAIVLVERHADDWDRRFPPEPRVPQRQQTAEERSDMLYDDWRLEHPDYIPSSGWRDDPQEGDY